MGREIRKVPPNWDHPRTNHYGDNRYKPLCDSYYPQVSQEWVEEFIKFEDEKKSGKIEGHYGCKYYWEYNHAPDEDMCVPYEEKDCTWIQVYETVSEGTPVTPPFATPEELIDYLIENGDFWYQQSIGTSSERFYSKPSRIAAENFVREGYAPSMMVCDGVITTDINTCEEKI